MEFVTDIKRINGSQKLDYRYYEELAKQEYYEEKNNNDEKKVSKTLSR